MKKEDAVKILSLSPVYKTMTSEQQKSLVVKFCTTYDKLPDKRIIKK